MDVAEFFYRFDKANAPDGGPPSDEQLIKPIVVMIDGESFDIASVDPDVDGTIIIRLWE